MLLLLCLFSFAFVFVILKMKTNSITNYEYRIKTKRNVGLLAFFSFLLSFSILVLYIVHNNIRFISFDITLISVHSSAALNNIIAIENKIFGTKGNLNEQQNDHNQNRACLTDTWAFYFIIAPSAQMILKKEKEEEK